MTEVEYSDANAADHAEDNNEVSTEPGTASSAASDIKFTDLGLCTELTDTVAEQGYTKPSPIQEKAIPAVLEGKDVMAAAQTGTGKTAGFTLPILDRLRQGRAPFPKQARVLILTPTRELAAQVAESVDTYGKKLRTTSAVVFGGVNVNPQKKKLAQGVDVLIATPGRLLDLYEQKAILFPRIETLVLDEADRMLDMGFITDILKIMALLPKQRQTILFSATFSDPIRNLAQGIMRDPVEISVTPPNSTVDKIEQCIYPVEKRDKPDLLAALIENNDWQQVLVFCRTKHGSDKLARILSKKGLESVAIHGNKAQNARTRALDEFKNYEVRVLVATDIAARGLDIDKLPHVVNYDLPNVPEDYVHRIGRTGRAGANGLAVSLVSPDEFEELANIEWLIKKILPRKSADGIVPDCELPESNIDKKPRFPKNKSGNSRGGRNERGPRGDSRGDRRSDNSRDGNRPPRRRNDRRDDRRDDRPREERGERNDRPRRNNRNDRRRDGERSDESRDENRRDGQKRDNNRRNDRRRNDRRGRDGDKERSDRPQGDKPKRDRNRNRNNETRHSKGPRKDSKGKGKKESIAKKVWGFLTLKDID